MSDRNIARILVVDDEPYLCEMLVDALAANDVEVITATNTEQAIALASRYRPDLLVTDLCLKGNTGTQLIDLLRDRVGDVPAIVITGHGDVQSLTDASRRRPVELMTKPLNVQRLRTVVHKELDALRHKRRFQQRNYKLRRLARQFNLERKRIQRQLEKACTELTSACRSLNEQMAMKQATIDFQHELLAARTDDDVFRSLFRLFIRQSGPVFGVAMVCNADAELQIVGRFGVPRPDGLRFCQALAGPTVNYLVSDPKCTLIDAGEQRELFDESIWKYLPGLTILAVPLIPVTGEIIGAAILYRKGEQPFTDGDLALAEMVSTPTGMSIKRNG